MSAPTAPPAEPEVTAPEPPPEPETETLTPVESAAPEATVAAEPQVTVEEPPKPDYITRADWEKEKADVAARAASDALELDRRRRQTENARRATQEKREQEERAETIDVVRATLASKLGVDPSLITDDAIDTAINRAATRRAQTLTSTTSEQREQVFDYLTAPIFKQAVEWDDAYTAEAAWLRPKLESLISQMTPQITEMARKGWISEEELPKRVDAEIARRNAKAREGQEELKRVEGQPASTIDRSLEAITSRIISNDADAEDKRMWESRFGRKT